MELKSISYEIMHYDFPYLCNVNSIMVSSCCCSAVLPCHAGSKVLSKLDASSGSRKGPPEEAGGKWGARDEGHNC